VTTAISVEDAVAAAQRMALKPDEHGRATCPSCHQAKALTISQSGDGAHLECAVGCDGAEIGILLRHVNKLAALAGTADTPIQQLRDQLTLPGLARVIKYGAAGEAFDLELENGTRVELGTARDVLNLRSFEAAIAGVTGIVIPAKTAAEHRKLVQLLLDVAELREATSADDELHEWLEGFERTCIYRRHVDTSDKPSLYDVVKAGQSFKDVDGRLYVRLADLRTYVTRQLGERTTGRELSRRLGRLGFTKPDHGGQIAVRQGAETTSGRYWISPFPPSPLNRELSNETSREHREHGHTVIGADDPGATLRAQAGTAENDNPPGTAGTREHAEAEPDRG